MKRWWCLAFVAAALTALVAGSPGRADDKEKSDAKKDSKAGESDLKQLQGHWIVVPSSASASKNKEVSHVLPFQHAFTVKDDKLTLRFSKRDFTAARGEAIEIPATKKGGKLETHFTIQIDPSQTPKGLDLVPTGDKAEPIKAIYELKGQTLRIGFGDGKERPKGFDSASHVIQYQLQEGKPAKAAKSAKSSS